VGRRWPRSELANVEIEAKPTDLSPAMARRIKPRYRVIIRTISGDELPFVFTTTSETAAQALAARIAEEAKLELASRPAHLQRG